MESHQKVRTSRCSQPAAFRLVLTRPVTANRVQCRHRAATSRLSTRHVPGHAAVEPSWPQKCPQLVSMSLDACAPSQQCSKALCTCLQGFPEPCWPQSPAPPACCPGPGCWSQGPPGSSAPTRSPQCSCPLQRCPGTGNTGPHPYAMHGSIVRRVLPCCPLLLPGVRGPRAVPGDTAAGRPSAATPLCLPYPGGRCGSCCWVWMRVPVKLHCSIPNHQAELECKHMHGLPGDHKTSLHTRKQCEVHVLLLPGLLLRMVAEDGDGHGVLDCRRLWRFTQASAHAADQMHKRAFIMSDAPWPPVCCWLPHDAGAA